MTHGEILQGSVLVCAGTVPQWQHAQGANNVTATGEPGHTSMPPFREL